MINLKPLIETFKKAIYGRDVRQSIVDLAQAIGDNHNEQETLRNEVKTLNADTKEENRQGKEYITNKTAEMDNAITAGKSTIETTVSTGKAAVDSKVSEAVSTIGSGKSELDTKINAGIGKLGAKTTEGEQALSAKTQSGISSLEQKTTKSTQTVEAVISRASESKAAVDTAITKAGESKAALESTIQQSESGKTTLDATIQQSTAKDKELENHIAEINQIIAEGKAVTKDELKAEILKLKGLSIEVLDTLPESGKAGVIYFIKTATQGTQNLFDEYAWVQNKWEMIGSKSIDLSQYVEKAEHESFKSYTVEKIGAIKGSVEKLDRKVEANMPLVKVVRPMPNFKSEEYDCFWVLQKTPLNLSEGSDASPFSHYVKAYCKVILDKNRSSVIEDAQNSVLILSGWKTPDDMPDLDCAKIFRQFKSAVFGNAIQNRYGDPPKGKIVDITIDSNTLTISFKTENLQLTLKNEEINVVCEAYI